MLDSKMIDILRVNLQRIFSMPITRSTFREIQNAIRAATHNDDTLYEDVVSALLNRNSSKLQFKGKALPDFKGLLHEYSVRFILAKDIYEKGEFVNFITSDTINRGEVVTFFNRIRRIDGNEYEFATDPTMTLQLILHFISKIKELSHLKTSKTTIRDTKKILKLLSERLNAILDSLPD